MDQNNQILNNSNTEGKTFTQEDVNRIVGERLAKEKNKSDASFAERESMLAAREKELANREALFNLKDKLKDMGLPGELLPVLNVQDEDKLNEALEAVKKYINEKSTNSEYEVINPIRLPRGEVNELNPVEKQLREAMHLPK